MFLKNIISSIFMSCCTCAAVEVVDIFIHRNDFFLSAAVNSDFLIYFLILYALNLKKNVHVIQQVLVLIFDCNCRHLSYSVGSCFGFYMDCENN